MRELLSDCLDHSIRFVANDRAPDFILFLRIIHKSFSKQFIVVSTYTPAAITPIDKDSERVMCGIADEALRMASQVSEDLNFS